MSLGKSCMNCKHKCRMVCVLFDELIEDNGYCFLHSYDEGRLWDMK